MTVHNLRRYGAWALLEVDVYADVETREGITTGLAHKASTAAWADHMTILQSRPPNVVEEWRVYMADRHPVDPYAGLPWEDGDIIPPGMRRLALITVTVAAYDPHQEDG